VLFSEEVGESVAAGDLNDDGVPDLVLGGPRPPVNGEDPGRTYVFFGPVSGSHLATEADVIIQGQRDNDEFGGAVATGDVNGDGAADLVVGAEQLFSDGNGRAYVFDGPLAPGQINAGSADAILLGEDSDPVDQDLFGQSVAVVGDTNGDDVGDVLVGAPTNYDGGTRSGRAYLFRGPLTGQVDAGDADRIFTGETFDELGTSVAAAFDADGDGLSDLIVGAPQFFGTNDVGYAAMFLGDGVPATGLQVTVTPIDPPIVVPAAGGTVRYRIEVVNRSAAQVTFDLWTELTPPAGSVRRSQPRGLTVGGGATLVRRARARISAGSPAGTYSLRVVVGTFPVEQDSDAFTFQKS
jgi:hypothetical protein